MRVRCPAIWCWGQRPLILVPPVGEEKVDWVAVFCHELAHWVRRDHHGVLLAEVLVCALPWHPLSWWARHRLGELSELACDDWVLAAGLPATDYAESLLSLVPQRRRAFALTALTGRRGLVGRLRHILEERRNNPAVGRVWSCASAVATVLVVSGIGLAQSQSGEIGSTSRASRRRRRGDGILLMPAKTVGTAMKRTIRGTVLGPGGQPAAGASVFWIGQRKPPLPLVAQKSNAQGEFVIDTLLPGVRLHVMAATRDREAGVPVKPLEPGEDRDLGTITLKERHDDESKGPRDAF